MIRNQCEICILVCKEELKKLGEEKTEGLCLDEIARKRVSKVKKLTFMIFNMLWYYVMKGEVNKIEAS